MKCWWCKAGLEQAEIGFCLVHSNTLLTRCVPDPGSHHALLEDVGQRKYSQATRTALTNDATEALLPEKNDRWPDWNYWVAGKRASALQVEYENGSVWIWFDEQGEYLVDTNKRIVRTTNGSEWTCEGIVRVKRKPKPKDEF